MKNILKYLACVCLGVTLLLLSFPASCEFSVGSIPFKNYSDDPSLDVMSQSISDAIAGELSRMKDVKLINENEVKDLLQERVIQQSLSSGTGKAVEGTRITSPRVLVIGGIYKEGNDIILKARMVDTGSGEIFGEVQSRENKGKEKVMMDGLAGGIREKLETYSMGIPSQAGDIHALPPHIVQVNGTGTSSSERAALILAKRNAVEKAVGSKLILKNIPNQRKVLSQAESTLSYDVVSRKKEGKNYIVVIKAQVTIPPELLTRYGLEAAPVTTGYTALKTSSRYGEVNWEEGFVIAKGRGKGKGPEEAKRAALVEARARALELVGGIPLDSEKTVKSFVSQEDKLAYELKGFIEKSEILEEKKISDNEAEVSINVPLTGVKGLTVLFIDAFVPEKETREETGAKHARAGYTGVVIDARGTGLRPSLFPKVSDEKGKVVYSPDKASRASVEKMGMASFVTAGKKETAGSAPIREGRKPLIIKAQGASGPLKANLILSPQDAEKLAETDTGSGILKGSKVVIMTDTPVGGTEG